MSFDDLDIDALRRRGGKKWSTYGTGVLPAWVADMDFPVAPAIRQRLQQVLDASDFGYPHDEHASRLTGLFAERCRERFQWPVDTQRVEVIADVVQGIRLCLALFTRPGEGAAILTPIYPPFLTATGGMGRRADCCVMKPAEDRYAVDWERLESTIGADTRVLLLCNPHNPTGRVFTRAELTRFAELALKHDLMVVSDEVHSDLVFSGHGHIPFASLGPEVEVRTVTLMSATKSFNIAGLRCAMMVFGSPAHQRMYREGSGLIRGATDSLAMHAAEAAWGEGDEWLAALNPYLESNRDLISDFLVEHLPRIQYLPPQATYLAWLDCSGLQGDGNPWRDILDRGKLALNDGREFGPGGEQCVRLNFATSKAVLEDALQRLRRGVA